MKRIYFGLVALGFVYCLATPALAELRIGIGVPRVNIRITLPVFPEFVLIPGLPVYYAPRLDANYFFYDGYYWAYVDDNWYASDWYDGPWWWVDPFDVPLFVLRIPVRYYRVPPIYFRDWPSHQPPRWGQRWGHDWERRHRDWDRWERDRIPRPAPLPDYQRQYSGKRYPKGEEQERLRREHERRDRHERTDRDEARERFERGEQRREESAPAPPQQWQQREESPLHRPQHPGEMRRDNRKLRNAPEQQRREENPPADDYRQQQPAESERGSRYAPPQQKERRPPQRGATHPAERDGGKGWDRGEELKRY